MSAENAVGIEQKNFNTNEKHYGERVYNKITEEGIMHLQNITSPERVFYGEAIQYEYHHDEMPEYGVHAPDVVVQAVSTEEVSAIMKYAYENRIPVTPRGAGTGLAGGAVALYGGIVLSLEKMNRILEWDMETLTVVVEPGVLVMELANAAIEKDLFYPPEPGEKTASVGGNVMTNAGGMKAVRYGVTRNYVVSMEVVLPDGTVLELSSNVVKNTSGYDLKDLVIGSEGTLCIVTKLRMRLIPLPKYSYTLLVPYDSMETCVKTVPRFINSPLTPTAIEFMPQKLLLDAEKYLGKVMPHKTANSYLILMFDGMTKEEVEQACDAAAEICFVAGAIDVFLCNTDERKEAVWSVRAASLEAIKASTTDSDECDIVVPRDRIADFVLYTEAKMKEIGIRVCISGHAGDGNMHLQLCRDQMPVEEFEEKTPILMRALYGKAKEIGGQVSGEHGIGHAKAGFLKEFIGADMLRVYKGIKYAFDDKGILNPGKVIG